MEHSKEALAIQGVFLSSDNTYSFSSLTSKGGNEEKINYVISSVRKFLEEQNYITTDGTIVESSIEKLRCIVLFIILNADLESVVDITEIDDLDIFIWVIPTIPKYLLCEIFWELKFDKFIQELISYCNPQLSLEIAAAFTENIKYSTPSSFIDKVQVVATSIYKIICRLQLYNFDENVLAEKLTMAFNVFEKCAYYFIEPPKPESIETFVKDEFFIYSGHCILKLLSIINNCLEQYVEIPELYPDDVGGFYTITHLNGSNTHIVDYKVCHSPNTSILDCLKKCHISLLDKLQVHTMHISVTIFCAWSEFNIGNKTMQQIIGEQCHKLRTKLLSITCLSDHPVVGMIQQLSRKPLHWKDLIEKEDSAALIEYINNNDTDKAECLHILINKDFLLDDDNLMQCVTSNIECLNEIDCFILANNAISNLKSGSILKNTLEKMAVKSFERCDITAKIETLEEYFSNKLFVNMTDDLNFALTLKEIFNKLILSPRTNMGDVVTVFFQNPKLVYNEIFKLAAENIQQTNIMLECLALLNKFSNHYYESDIQPCIIMVIQECFETYDQTKLENLLTFICGLKKNNCVTGAKLLLLIIMPKLHKALLNRDLENLYIQSKLLMEAFKLEELLEYRAPLLAMLAQMLDVARWKMNTFESASPKTLRICLQIQISLFNSYFTTGIPAKETQWLKSKLKYMQPMNMYYYRKLWNPPGRNFLEIISGKRIHRNMDTENLGAWLSNILCISITQEWSDAWDSLDVLTDAEKLDTFHEAVSLLTLAESVNSTPVTWHCLLYNYRNFVNIIRYKFFKEPLQNGYVMLAVHNISITMNLAEEHQLKAMQPIFLPLFAYMAERKNDYTFNVPQYITTKLKHQLFVDMIKKVFSDNAH